MFIAYLFFRGKYIQNSEPSDKSQNYDFEKRLTKRFQDENIIYFHSYYYTKLETTVMKVNLNRAVFEYAESFKSYFNNEQTLNNNNYIIDLSNALFLDSTFLGAIIYSIKMANSRGADLSIIMDLNEVTILAQLKNLNKIMTIYQSLEEAIEQLQNGSQDLSKNQ
jgi:anti-sigma B factor antagonist